MKRAILLALLAVFTGLPVIGQTFDYGNDWYDSNLNYVKILVWEDGVYRVSKSELDAAGFDPSADPANLHLYYRGEEQYIHVEPNGGSYDFIEFYGRRNDGQIDSLSYVNPATGIHSGDRQPNHRYSIWTDTSAYFLTVEAQPGLRMDNYVNTAYGGMTPVSTIRTVALHEYTYGSSGANYTYGGGAQYDSYHNLNCAYVTGEGYVGHGYGSGGGASRFLYTPYPANLAGGSNDLHVRIFGQSNYQHIVETRLNGSSIRFDTTSGVYIKTWSYPNVGNVNNGNNTVQVRAWGTQQNNTDNNRLCWLSLTYDRLPNMDAEGALRIVSWDEVADTYLRLTNANANSEAWVWDMRNMKRCVATVSADTIKAIIPGSAQMGQLEVVSDTALRQAMVVPSALANHSDPASGAEFIIITNRQLQQSAEAYAYYRDTNTVNSYTTKVVYTDELYDEFGYGSFTPVAIKRFCKYALDNYSTPPKYFFIWGHGQYEYRNHPNNLVPVQGYPASDYEFVGNWSYQAERVAHDIPIGRVNVFDNDEGMVYLAKIIEYEHTPWEPWMKEGVLLGGGSIESEQLSIGGAIKGYADRMEDAPLGGEGWYYQKMNNGLDTDSPNMSSSQRIDDGVGIIHFFGHSTSNVFDVDIQPAYLYQNYGKYPLMVAFGCYGGNWTGDGKSFGESFVSEPGRGSIGYLANSTAGYLGQLAEWGGHFYEAAYDSLYGQSIGEIIRFTSDRFLTQGSPLQIYTNHARQMNLQGDPSLSLYAAPKPDLAISESDISFGPPGYSANDSVFEIEVIVHNYGLVAQDSFYLSVRQMSPQGTWVAHPMQKFPPVIQQDTITLTLQNYFGAQLAGLNEFDVFVDSTNIIDEISELNNRVQAREIIQGDLPAVLHPFEYAVVPSSTEYLAASLFVPSNAPSVNYIFEIDDNYDFQSPLASSGVVQGTGAWCKWDLPFALQDSAVYYWRVRLANVSPALWATSSFRYIAGQEGWAQAQPAQFIKDGTEDVSLDMLIEEWKFDPRVAELYAWMPDGGDPQYRLQGGAFGSELPSGVLDGVMYTTISQTTLAPAHQNLVHGDWVYIPTPGSQSDLVSAIANCPQGDFFFLSSRRNARLDQWSAGAFTALYSIGVDTAALHNADPDESFLILGRKGFPGQAFMVLGPNYVDTLSGQSMLEMRVQLNGSNDGGQVYSTLIGPAVDYTDLIWNWNTLDAQPNERAEVSVYGIDVNGVDSLIWSSLDKGSYSLASIDPADFPRLRLEADMKDSLRLTAPQMDHWHVIFDAAPEAAIDPFSNFNFQNDTVYVGQTVSVDFEAMHLFGPDMDSMLVTYSVIYPNQTVEHLDTVRYAPLPAATRLPVSYSFITASQDMIGDCYFTIEINPFNDQPEMYHFNNLYTYAFHVLGDKVHPILDVTFDGKHIIDGDLVSPSADILIEINDENPYLAVNDTAFEVYFGPKNQGPSAIERIFIDGNSQMEKIPAQMPDNKARLHFRPGPLADGEYVLRVQGYDQSGNAAGEVEYEISFEVVNQNAVSRVLPYPNPFSTAARWAYTLTGDQLPEVFEIRVFTISGKLVKTIDLAAMGEVHYGYNITEYAWDGRDEYGDLLANGVYIYQVVTRINGEETELRDEGIDQFFNKGFGKLYIMR